ncbi:COMPASS (complex proteins associated with Set1p) component [Arthrobotrys megalospora]
MADPMDTDQPPPLPIEQSLEGVLFPVCRHPQATSFQLLQTSSFLPISILLPNLVVHSGGAVLANKKTKFKPTFLLPRKKTSTPPPNSRQISRLSHPPPPIDSPVLSAAQTPSKPSPPNMSMMKEDTPVASSVGVPGVNGKSGGSGGVVAGEGKGAGAPVRQYLNEFVTPYLLEGMKIIARDQPSNPLEALGRYLLQQSQIYEANMAYGQEGGTPRAEVKVEEAA